MPPVASAPASGPAIVSARLPPPSTSTPSPSSSPITTSTTGTVSDDDLETSDDEEKEMPLASPASPGLARRVQDLSRRVEETRAQWYPEDELFTPYSAAIHAVASTKSSSPSGHTTPSSNTGTCAVATPTATPPATITYPVADQHVLSEVEMDDEDTEDEGMQDEHTEDESQEVQDMTPSPTPQTDTQRIYQLEAETALLHQRLAIVETDRDELLNRVLALEAAAVNAFNLL